MTTEELILKSFQSARMLIKESGNGDEKFYKRRDKLTILAKKIEKGLENEQINFSKNELKIIESYKHIYQNTINTTDETTQIVYDYIVEYLDKNKKCVCLCEPGECCRKCCVHPDTTCIWKNYIDTTEEWNDPDNVWFGSFKGIHY